MAGEPPTQYCAKCADPLSMCCCPEPEIVAGPVNVKPPSVSSGEWVAALDRAWVALTAVEQLAIKEDEWELRAVLLGTKAIVNREMRNRSAATVRVSCGDTEN